MNRRRRSLLQRIGDVLRGAIGGGAQRRPPPPPQRYEPEEIPEPPPTPRQPPGIPDTPLRGNVSYEHEKYTIVGSHSRRGRAFNYTQKVLGRHTVGDEMNPADIYDVRDVLNQSGKQ